MNAKEKASKLAVDLNALPCSQFFDKNGAEIRVGDILKYQETADAAEDYGKSIDEVVMHNGEICGIQRVGFPRWTTLRDEVPVELRHYASYSGNVTKCAEVIGNVRDHPERITPEYAWFIFSANAKDQEPAE